MPPLILYILSENSGMEYEELTQTIIGCGMRVHHVLGPGFL